MVGPPNFCADTNSGPQVPWDKEPKRKARMTNKTPSAIDLVERVARAVFDAMHPTSDPVVREQYCQSSRYRNAARAAIEAQSDTITRLQAALTAIANAQRIGADSDILAWKSLAHACQSEAVKALRSSVGGE